MNFIISYHLLIYIARFWISLAVCVCITLFRPFNFPSWVYVVLLTSWTLANGCAVLYLAALLGMCVPIVLMFFVRMSSISMSEMPSKACPFPGITQKLPIFCLLCSIFTLHISNCVVVLLYVLTGYFYFLLPLIVVLLPQEIMFCICVRPLCFLHCLCLLYKVLWF